MKTAHYKKKSQEKVSEPKEAESHAVFIMNKAGIERSTITGGEGMFNTHTPGVHEEHEFMLRWSQGVPRRPFCPPPLPASQSFVVAPAGNVRKSQKSGNGVPTVVTRVPGTGTGTHVAL